MAKRAVATVPILGIPLFSGNIQEAASKVVEMCCLPPSNRPFLISATGAHGLVTAYKDPSFFSILSQFFLNLPDGKPAVWVGRLKGAKNMTRCYGPDFFEEVIRTSATFPIGHYLCGGKQGVTEQLRLVCTENFGNANIVGTYSPPFRPLANEEFEWIGNEINQLGAHIVWIGISTPKQEMFAWRLARYTKAYFIITVGAAFDFHIGAVPRAPHWMQEGGLEWLFRLLSEPRRLWKRYAEIVPKFILYSFIDLVRWWHNESKPLKD